MFAVTRPLLAKLAKTLYWRRLLASDKMELPFKPEGKGPLMQLVQQPPQPLGQQVVHERPWNQPFSSAAKEPPTTTPPPELSDLRFKFVRQFLAIGQSVTTTAQRKGAGPWLRTPVYQHTFQSSKPGVRITVTPRHGEPIEYTFSL